MTTADSLGGFVQYAIQMPQPTMVAASRPLVRSGQRTNAPDSGWVEPRSAMTSAISRNATPPMPQVRMAAGPAT